MTKSWCGIIVEYREKDADKSVFRHANNHQEAERIFMAAKGRGLRPIPPDGACSTKQLPAGAVTYWEI